jgi:type VI secretion system ImpC/EvpB family protein/type VI secretion system ImpB/VipA family protein
MAGDKGFLTGGMKFGVGDDDGVAERGPVLPLRLLVIADLVPRDPHNAGASAPAAPIRVDPARFDELFGRLRPRIAIDVPSVLAEGRPVRVDLAPTSLKSFRPDGLCAEVPLLRSLLDGRLVLDRLRDGSSTVEQARVELERLWSGSSFAREVLGLIGAPRAAAAAPSPAAPAAAAVAPSTTGGGDIDSLLSMVEVGARAPRPAPATVPEVPSARARAGTSGRVADLIASVALGGRATAGGVRPTEAIARVDKALGAQIGAILQHPEVRRLEQAWRGLRLLADRAQPHGGVRLELLSARAEDAGDAFARALASGTDEPPIGFAVIDVTVDGSAASFSRLETLASAAEEATVPIAVNASSKLLGLDHLAPVERIDDKAGLFGAPERAPWRSAAAKPPMRWVGLAMNGALARPPYDKATARVREAVVHELPDDDGGFVWIPPAYLLGALVVASFRDTGWPCRVVGPQRGGVVDNLPVREIPSGYEGDDAVAIPTEAFVSTETQRALAKMGVLVFASAPNSDAAVAMTAPTAYVPPDKRSHDSATTEPEARLDRVSLGDQLFVARLAQFTRALCSRLPASSDPAEVQPVVEGALWTLFESAPPGGLEISVRAKTGSVEVTVRPRRFLGVALEEVTLEIPLG